MSELTKYSRYMFSYFNNTFNPTYSEGSVSYDEALEIVEKFMRDTGIREYCENTCQGHCCGGCKEACHVAGLRNLACSVYICPIISKLFWRIYKDYPLDRLLFSDEQMLGYIPYPMSISKVIATATKGAPYFKIHSPRERAKIRIPLESLWTYRYWINTACPSFLGTVCPSFSGTMSSEEDKSISE